MPTVRSRTSADVRRELEATEQRLLALIEQWQQHGMTAHLGADGAASREHVDRVEELLRQQRGAVERLHQLWIEYAQSSGLHAPQ